MQNTQKDPQTHLRMGFILLVLLLLLLPEEDPPEPLLAPFPEGYVEFISADFWNTSMVALAMFSSREWSSWLEREGGVDKAGKRNWSS